MIPVTMLNAHAKGACGKMGPFLACISAMDNPLFLPRICDQQYEPVCVPALRSVPMSISSPWPLFANVPLAVPAIPRGEGFVRTLPRSGG